MPFLLFCWGSVGCMGGAELDPPPVGTPADTTSLDTGESVATTDTAPVDHECIARFVRLQKDAYSDEDGRNVTVWPPHTTTAIEFICRGDTWSFSTLSNHGTGYTDLTPSGDFWLKVMDTTDEVDLTSETLEELTAAYQDCTCEASGDYVSLSAVADPGVDDLLQGLAAFTNTHLHCVDGTLAADVAQWLEDGDIESVLGKIEQCNLGDLTWEDGFAAALDATGLSSSEQHSCNNDAVLQAEWWFQWAETREILDCDGGSATCSGPLWFYDL